MNEDKALDIIAKIKADREELERAIIDVVESLYKMAACTSGRWVSADIPPHPTRLPGLAGTGGGNSIQL